MQTILRPLSPKKPQSSLPSPHRRRFALPMFIGVIVTIAIVLGAGTFVFFMQRVGSHAAATANPDCSLVVPQNPLSAQGLATPYKLIATDPNNGPCNEANVMQAAFVQGAVLDQATGRISIYNPLVVDQGTQPAATPVVPQLPQRAVVALWFGFNGGNLTLKGTRNSLQMGNCVNGVNGSIFGQFSYCNASAFFQAANQAIRAGKLVPPALGTARDGQPCPTVRDFAVVDQDQSDNVTTTYLITGNQTAQMTAANSANLQNVQTQTNGSDNRLVAVALDGALGCTAWKAPDLADPGQMVPALPLNELQAAAHQGAPVALVPNLDPMVVVNNNRNQNKLNTYRAGVDQPAAQSSGMASTKVYCINLMKIAPMRIALDAPFTKQRPSPDPAAANNLFNFLGQRFVATWTNLNCQKLTGKQSPIAVKVDDNGVAIQTMINGQDVAPPPNAPNCNVNGTVVTGCTGTATINGKSCSFAVDTATNQINITCPAVQGQQGQAQGLNLVQDQVGNNNDDAIPGKSVSQVKNQ